MFISDCSQKDSQCLLVGWQKSINGEYKTDSGEESIIIGGNGISFKKVTKLTETWHQMENLSLKIL